MRLPERAGPNVDLVRPSEVSLKYIPQPNVGSNLFSDSAENETLADNKAAARLT